MTERRPHWDDDLLAAVLRYLHDPAPLTDDDRAWNIVEAVEDWQEREKTRCKSDGAYHCTTHDTQWLDDESDRCEYKRMVDAEAAIARVRELHHTTVDCVESREGPRDVEHCAECGYIPLDGEMCPTIRALEGDSDD